MKLFWIENNKISEVIARAYKSKNNELYYNVSIGDRYDRRLWAYKIAVSSFTLSKPLTETDTRVLTGSYRLVPIMKKTARPKQVKDLRGNYMYMLEKLPDDQNDIDRLLFINIPNDYFIKVVYSLQGNCRLIGKGTNGRFRENISYKSPALVVEATGTCTIAWEGTRSDGTIVRGEYKYTDYDNVISIKKG